MDLSIAVESWREGIKTGMRREPLWKKLSISFFGLLVFILTLVLGIYGFKFWGDVLHIQNDDAVFMIYNDTFFGNSTFYDIEYLAVNQTEQVYSDLTKATELNTTLYEDCDDDCLKKGSQWSIVYALAGWTLIFMAINGVLLMLGGWIYRCRMLGIFCHHFLTIFLLASIITTYRYRNRTQGELCALSLLPSHLSGGSTYADDADFIDKFFIGQLICLILCLVFANVGCCKCGNNMDIRDSQVQSSMANSNVVPVHSQRGSAMDQQQLLNDD